MILKIVIGLLMGFAFGLILQRTGITKYPRVTGLLLLKDFKILKFMLTAVTISLVGFTLMSDLGLIQFNPKPLDWGKLVGGLIFGVGMGLLGYCPGTALSRIGEGKKDAWLGLLGMVLGILVYALNVQFFKAHLLARSINGNLFEALGVQHWIVVPLAVLIFGGIILGVNKYFRDDRQIF